MNILKRIKHKTWEAMKKRWKKIKSRAKRNEISIIASIRQEIKNQIWKITYKAQGILGKIKEWWSQLNFHWKFWIIWFSLVIFTSSIIYLFLWDWVSNFYGLSKKPMQGQEPHSQIIRNLGWLAWMAISFLGLSVGLDLAIWGRQIQHKSHLQERYEKAASMLGNEVMPVRVAGCRALMSLGIEDKSMKVLCVRLLFAFINNPYLKEAEESEDINVLFSDIEEPLRADIQSAVNSFSAIYEHYGKKGIDKERVDLPDYFWKNQHKGKVSLINTILNRERWKMHEAYLRSANLQKANLRSTNLEKANLEYANLYKVNFIFANLQGAKLGSANLQKAILSHANLQGASFGRADLRGADLSDTKLQEAYLGDANLQGANLNDADVTNTRMTWKRDSMQIASVNNLTKEQIISAIWGIDKNGNGTPPSLPKKLMQDPEVQNWLATPYYNKKEEAEEEAEIALREIAEEAAAEIEKE